MGRVVRVLVVNDDAAIAEPRSRGRWAPRGYAVDVAANGRDALQVARDRTPDLVVLKKLMSGHGSDVCRRLRAAEQHLPIVLLTTINAITDRVTGLEAGADDYLVKPFALELSQGSRILRRRRGNSSPPGTQVRPTSGSTGLT